MGRVERNGADRDSGKRMRKRYREEEEATNSVGDRRCRKTQKKSVNYDRDGVFSNVDDDRQHKDDGRKTHDMDREKRDGGGKRLKHHRSHRRHHRSHRRHQRDNSSEDSDNAGGSLRSKVKYQDRYEEAKESDDSRSKKERYEEAKKTDESNSTEGQVIKGQGGDNSYTSSSHSHKYRKTQDVPVKENQLSADSKLKGPTASLPPYQHQLPSPDKRLDEHSTRFSRVHSDNQKQSDTSIKEKQLSSANKNLTGTSTGFSRVSDNQKQSDTSIKEKQLSSANKNLRGTSAGSGSQETGVKENQRSPTPTLSDVETSIKYDSIINRKLRMATDYAPLKQESSMKEVPLKTSGGGGTSSFYSSSKKGKYRSYYG